MSFTAVCLTGVSRVRDSLGESAGMPFLCLPVLLLAVGRGLFPYSTSCEGPAGCRAGEKNDNWHREFQFHGTFTTPWTKPTHTVTYGCINIWMKHRCTYANMHTYPHMHKQIHSSTLTQTHSSSAFQQFLLLALVDFPHVWTWFVTFISWVQVKSKC